MFKPIKCKEKVIVKKLMIIEEINIDNAWSS